MISPTWMAVINGLATIGLGLEGTGLTNVLPSQWGVALAAIVAGLNTVAHSVSAPQAGPLVKNGGSK